MALTTTTQITAPVNRVYQNELLMNAMALCPYFEGMMEGDLQQHAGSFTIAWKRIENLTPTVTALTQLSGNLSLPTRNATQLSETIVTATVAKYGDHVFCTEEVDLIHPDNQIAMGKARVLGIQAGRSLNRLQRNVVEDNATLIYASGGAADGDVADPIDLTLIRNATNQLARQSAVKFTEMTTGSRNIGTTPIRPAFLGICHSDVEEDIRDIVSFKPVETYASQDSVLRGEFGMVGGVRFISTEEASIDADSGGDPGQTLRGTGAADLYTTVIYGMEAFGSVGFGMEHVSQVYKAGDPRPTVQMLFKPRGSAGAGDPFDEVSTMAWKSWWGGAQLNANFSRGLRTGARLLS